VRHQGDPWLDPDDCDQAEGWMWNFDFDPDPGGDGDAARFNAGRLDPLNGAWWCDPEGLETLHYALGNRRLVP
jgi:hypothetical protein